MIEMKRKSIFEVFNEIDPPIEVKMIRNANGEIYPEMTAENQAKWDKHIQMNEKRKEAGEMLYLANIKYLYDELYTVC